MEGVRTASVEFLKASELMHHVGSCPICGDGLLGVRICGDHALVVCDECEALWPQPSCAGPPRYPSGETSPCPRCGKPLWGSQAHWATTAEINERGWSDFVRGESADRPSPASSSLTSTGLRGGLTLAAVLLTVVVIVGVVVRLLL